MAKSRKMTFEDGVRSAMITGVVICGAILAAAGFFAVRSVLGGEAPSPVARPGILEAPPEPAAPEPAEPALPETDAAKTPELLAELEEAGRKLEAEAAQAQAIAQAETTPPVPPAPAAPSPAVPPPPAAVPAPASPPPPAVPPVAAPPAPSPQPAVSAPPAAAPTIAAAVSPAAPAKPAVQAKRAPPPILPPERRGIIVFVIDDAGNNLTELTPFLSLSGPLTIAVLPALPNSVEAARRVRDAKKELILHQPMEAIGTLNPGPGVIKTGMSADEITRIVNQNLNEIWPVTGMNNHEGSKATTDPALVKTVLEICQERNLIFLDSKTIGNTVVPAVARSMAFNIAERDIFIDNDRDRASIMAMIEEGCKRAERNGLAIMIGHAWSPELAGILKEMYPVLTRRGFYLAALSTVLDAGK